MISLFKKAILSDDIINSYLLEFEKRPSDADSDRKWLEVDIYYLQKIFYRKHLWVMFVIEFIKSFIMFSVIMFFASNKLVGDYSLYSGIVVFVIFYIILAPVIRGKVFLFLMRFIKPSGFLTASNKYFVSKDLLENL